MPERIVALGVEFSRVDQQRFKWFILAVVVYFLVEFLVFVRKDYIYLVFGEPLLSATSVGNIAIKGSPYKWAFWLWRLRTPELYRSYIGDEPPEQTLRREMATRFGFQMRSSVFPIPRYGLQCWIDVWIPVILASTVIVSLLLWTPTRLPEQCWLYMLEP